MMNNLMEIMGDVAEVAFEVEVKISDAASWTFMFWHLFIRVEFSDCLNLLQNVWLCFINRLDLFLSSVDKFLWYGFLNLMRLNSICSVDIFSILFYFKGTRSCQIFVNGPDPLRDLKLDNKVFFSNLTSINSAILVPLTDWTQQQVSLRAMKKSPKIIVHGPVIFRTKVLYPCWNYFP